MSKRLTVVLTTIVIVFAVASNAGAAGVRGTVEGSVLDSTCFGPCSIDMEPRPYTGEATVVVRRLPHRHRVRALIPDPGGTFEIRLAKGRYSLQILIEDSCFVEDSVVLRVSAGDVDRPEFSVYNGCIV